MSAPSLVDRDSLGMSKISILVVSSSPITRAGIATLLGEAGYEGVAQAPSLAALDNWPVEDRPAALVCDPASDDEIDMLLDYLEADPMVLPIVLGGATAGERLARTLARRPWAYLRQDSSAAALSAALSTVQSGLTVLDPDLDLALHVRREDAGDPDDDLTPREREVLNLIGLGLANKTIAVRLGISEHTAKFHVASVLAKLGAATRAEAVRIGAARGLLAL